MAEAQQQKAGSAGAKKKKSMRKASAIKRARQALKRQAHNLSLHSQLKNQIKSLRKTLEGKKKEEAKKLLTPTLSIIARMASKRIIHQKTASRLTSRLTQQFNRI